MPIARQRTLFPVGSLVLLDVSLPRKRIKRVSDRKETYTSGITTRGPPASIFLQAGDVPLASQAWESEGRGPGGLGGARSSRCTGRWGGDGGGRKQVTVTWQQPAATHRTPRRRPAIRSRSARRFPGSGVTMSRTAARKAPNHIWTKKPEAQPTPACGPASLSTCHRCHDRQ